MTSGSATSASGHDPAMGERGGHLQAERGGLDDDRAGDRIQDLVPLHRPSDVLDVVEAV
jgi:hypothetical protein